MTTNRYSAFAPIGLNFQNNKPRTFIRSLTDAARVLIQDWPLDDEGTLRDERIEPRQSLRGQ